MHTEYFHVDTETLNRMNESLGNIVAVGTLV